MVAEQIAAAPAEVLAGAAFSKQSVIFDDLYSSNTIVNYKRARVRAHISPYLKPNSHILELNSGTGEDALYFASQGHFVHATDISEGMQQVLKGKVANARMGNAVTNEICSFTNLKQLQNRGPYYAIFSNFGGLNCTNELHKVLSELPNLLKPSGTATLVIIPPFCLWETLLIFKGKFKTATRRFFSKNGRIAHVEGQYFKCWYYSPGYVKKHCPPDMQIINIEGLCTIVPPSYIEGFAEKHPAKFAWLKGWEGRLKHTWPWRNMGDYFVVTLRKV